MYILMDDDVEAPEIKAPIVTKEESLEQKLDIDAHKAGDVGNKDDEDDEIPSWYEVSSVINS